MIIKCKIPKYPNGDLPKDIVGLPLLDRELNPATEIGLITDCRALDDDYWEITAEIRYEFEYLFSTNNSVNIVKEIKTNGQH